MTVLDDQALGLILITMNSENKFGLDQCVSVITRKNMWEEYTPKGRHQS